MPAIARPDAVRGAPSTFGRGTFPFVGPAGGDTAARRGAAADRLARQALVAEISRRFVAIGADEIDGAVVDALGLVGRSVEADAVGLIHLAADEAVFTESHVWSDPAAGPLPPRPARLPVTMLGAEAERLLCARVWLVRDPALLPDRAHTALVQRLGARSFAWVPVQSGGRLVGTLALLWRVHATPLDEEDLAPFGVVGDVLLGALARTRAEAEKAELTRTLEAERRRLRELVASVPGVIWELWLDPDGGMQTTFISDFAADLWGYSEAELQTADFWQRVLHPEDRALVTGDVAEALAGRAPERRTVQVRWRRGDGQIIWTEIRRTLVRDATGRVVGLRGVTMDITEQKRTEAQLVQAQQMEALGRLAAGVAHDFNNLLVVVQMQTDAALGEIGGCDPVRRRLGDVRDAALRASRLTRQLLAFGRQQRLDVRPLPLNPAIAGLEPMLRHLLREDITLELRLDPALGCVRADPGQVDQVLVNLVTNARDAMPDGGRLVVETAVATFDEAEALRAEVAKGAYARLAVSDTGLGMDAGTLAQIFQPFFSTKVRDKGTGLGLSTVYGIVRQHDGHVRVESAPGRGTRFEIFLPLAAEASGAAAEPAHPRPAPPSGGRILLVEDEDMVRRLVAEALSGAGFEVLAAANGAEALARAAEVGGRLDLLLTDLIMPGMNGRELHRRLRAPYPDLPVLYVSGYTGDLLGHHGVLEPGTNFLPKPFSIRALLAAVSELVSQRRASPPPTPG